MDLNGQQIDQRLSSASTWWLVVLLFGWLLLPGGLSASGSGGINAPDVRDRPYLILVSIDGFRWDYQDLYDTPAMDRIAATGVRADAMIPVFPTLTFPNHYSIATGLYPAHHGLIGNRFPSEDGQKFYSLYDRESVQDGSWYGGEPIWVAAERAGLVTAAYYFVGTEAPVDGVPMTYWQEFDAKVPGISRVNQALEWLAMDETRRPHLVTLYFEHVDTATHTYGPGTPQSIAAIEQVDGYLGELLQGIASLPIADEVYIILVSDHGQARIKDDDPLIIESVASLDGVLSVDHGAISFLYLAGSDRDRAIEIRDAINRSWNQGRAMLRDETPASWHLTETAGFADLIVQADPGYTVYSSSRQSRHSSVGDHGWAPEFEDMRGIFLASGPRLPKGVRVAPISATDVYPLMMQILSLPISGAIDGDLERLPSLLQPR
jgi:predicted AlkP superfamily pyrophosphatase or phosphodiesterase